MAEERELAEGTIFSNLSKFISSGVVMTIDLISETHYKELSEKILTIPFESLSELKQQLDEKYIYSEIRLVLTEMNNKKT